MRKKAEAAPTAPDPGTKAGKTSTKSMALSDVATVIRAFLRPVMVTRAKNPEPEESPVLKRAADIGVFAESMSFKLDDGYNGTINERIKAMVGRFEATMGGRDPETGLVNPVKHIPKFDPSNEIILYIAVVPGHKAQAAEEAQESQEGAE